MTDEITRALAVLFPEGGVVEVRALADYATHSGYFDDHAALAEKARFLDRLNEVQGVYVTLNAVNPALLSRRANRIKMKLGRKDSTTADADIIRRRWLPVDLDPVRPSGVSSSEEEHAAALARADRIAGWLSEQGFPAPVLADSGNGAHLLYRIDLDNDEAATALVKACLTTLDALFSGAGVTVDTANYNAARIWKLYGTTSKKGDHTPERPHRTARLIRVPEEAAVVSDEQLRRLADLLPREPAPPKQSGAGIDLRTWLRDHGLGVADEKPWQGGTLFVLEDCPFSSAHRDGAFAIQFGNGAVFAGCHHASCGGGSQRWPELRGRYEPREKRTQKKKEETLTPPPAPDPAATDRCRERVLAILREGDPLAFMLEAFHRDHVGDTAVATCLIMSVASQQVANTRGLHVAISGNSGKGKTHACKTMLSLLPEEYRLTGTVSNKALFYHDALRPGTVLLFDDVTLSEDLQELLKSSTANFKEPIEHRTLTTDRQLRVCTIPPRCVWWLAKVENVGDDQVMNRMLTVWIDDSKEQDAAVLTHLKTSEEQGPEAGTVSREVHVCRAIWAVLKERLIHVTIPFATRIQFSNAANRRNPGILFDLIKCHALLRCLQRERVPSASGELCILATREDFDVAVELYASLNGATGGQETKLTKNEAAALETVSAMGAEVFTIKQLQQATGLTYYQTYRILHGYASRGAEYAGLLSKCPAVSFVDATVAEDCIGYTVRRREHHFSFDTEVYREWIAGPGIWLANDCNTAAGLAQDCSTDRKDGERQDGPDSSLPSPVLERRTVHDSTIQQLESTRKPGGEPGGAWVGVCVLPDAVNQKPSPQKGPHSPRGGLNVAGSASGTIRKDGGSRPPAAKRGALNPADYLPLPVMKDEPCHVCGGGPVSSLRKGSGDPPEYLCYTCLTRAKGGKTTARARPLPGVLDHRAFVRTGVELGTCRICGEGKAVFHSAGDHSAICEECYGRLVREWNKGQGVR